MKAKEFALMSMLPNLLASSTSKYKRPFCQVLQSAHGTIKASRMLIAYCAIKTMPNSRTVTYSLSVRRIRSAKDFPYTPLKTRVEKRDLFLADKSYKVFYNASTYAKEKGDELHTLLQYLCKKQATSHFTRNIDELIEVQAL